MGDQHNVSSVSTNSAASYGTLSPKEQCNADYMAQLLKDKRQLAAFPNILMHAERLIDNEISRVRTSLFQLDGREPLDLPEPEGDVISLQEKVYVPVDQHPDFNFVGRILGPRGMTAKQLEQEVGCKIMVRGRGSMRDKVKEEQNRGKPNWEHLNENLHVLITVEDYENRAKLRVRRAIEEIEKLLIPSPEGEDDLKRKQLMELAIINGTYRTAIQSQAKFTFGPPRLLTPLAAFPASLAALRSSALSAPIILSPSRLGPASSPNGHLPPPLVSPATVTDHLSANGLLYSAVDPAMFAAAVSIHPYHGAGTMSLGSHPMFTPTLGSDYTNLDVQGAILSARKLLGQVREHPYQKDSPRRHATGI